MNIKTDEIFTLLDKFIEDCKIVSKKHPYIVVILMHEYFRNIWPNDPFIEQKFSNDKLDSIILCLKNCIQLLSLSKDLGSYIESSEIENSLKNFKINTDEGDTQIVYGELWKSLDEPYITNETQNILKNILEKGGISSEYLKNKNILDMGCGSGRFTIALANMCAKKVTGIDLGSSGIKIGQETAKKSKLDNIEFIKNNVLSLPFDDESFDFVFSKGVLHHTGNLKQALNEYHRVMKKNGKGYLYLYGSGGIFWNSRKKMREVMKNIPMDYTLSILKIIGMPNKRYIFVDSWYVPIEEHVKREWFRKFS